MVADKKSEEKLNNTAEKRRRRNVKKLNADITFSAGLSEMPAEKESKPVKPVQKAAPLTTLLFQEPDVTKVAEARRVRRQKSQEKADAAGEDFSSAVEDNSEALVEEPAATSRRSRRGSRGGTRSKRRRGTEIVENENTPEDLENSAEEDSVDKGQRGATSKGAGSRSSKRAEAKAEAAEIDAAAGGTEKAAKTSGESAASGENDEENSPKVRLRRRRSGNKAGAEDEVTAPRGSTRLEAKKLRRKKKRAAGKRHYAVSESEFLARRESVQREMLIQERDGLNQIAVIEDGVLVEHFVARHTQTSMVGNVYLGRVQNVLPSMEAAFVDIGKGRNAVLYAGEVNWEATGIKGQPRKIEDALKSGDPVLVQVTKDPIGHKGARLTAQITLAGRHLVLVPNGNMTGISRKLPEKERTRLKRILKKIVPEEYGVIVRTAAEGATEEQLTSDIERLLKKWKDISAKSKSSKNAPSLLKAEPELAVRVVRDVFNEDFASLTVSGENTWKTVKEYVEELSPELEERLIKADKDADIFHKYRVDEQLQKAFDRIVFLPSGGSLVIDRTEAMTVIDVNTGKFTGSGGTLEETVTKNNLEAAEEIVRQLRLRDIGGIIVIDFIDMIMEENRDLVLRRLIECLGRDRTRHQVAEVTSLGLVQMTRKRVGQGLVEAFSTVCTACAGRGYISHDHPIEKGEENSEENKATLGGKVHKAPEKEDPKQAEVKAALANIAAAAAQKHEQEAEEESEETEKSVEKPVGNSMEDSAEQQLKAEKAAKARGREAAKESRKARAPKETAPKDAKKNTQKNVKKAAQKVAPAAEAAAPAAEENGHRRVSSAGTITPVSADSFTIMSFPVEKN
ncbi:Rne/Rng family ribonuclease [Arcanobacterium urinimassiliense]|uniref:Rne/Rng family ribonuclease n=1 Tax=Arcanobacterium urinimassiliense TaxID=1871014 RepID=UPI00093C506B|nr:Rne/Rng family ribonuclease [Arcanobacterium urinimassiliense]